jgi:hypothetical protein
MRRTLPVAIGCVLLAIPLFAQRGGHGGGGGARGGGGGGFHGAASGGFRGSSAGFRGGGFRGGGSRGGFRGVGGYRGFRGYYGGSYYPGYYGYYNPFLWDTGWGYGDDGSGYAADQYNDYGGYGSYGAPNPSPQVMIISNQAPPPVYVQSPPAVWEAGATTQAKKYEDTLFLLAMNDGTIRAVLAYWVDGTTVHYVTMDHEQKQTPLSSLDHGLTFRLPG